MQIDTPLVVNHFTIKIPLPEKSTLQPYKSAHTSGKSKKCKHKFDKFTYYRVKEDEIIKLLYKDDDTYLLQGKYPFVDPESKLCSKK